MLASASPEQYAGSLEILLSDPAVNGVMVILPPPPLFTAGAVAKAMIPVIHQSKKPVVVALMGERLIQEAVEHLRAAQIPEYRFPERAASALAALAQRAEFLERADDSVVEFSDTKKIKARSIFDEYLQNVPLGGWLPAAVIEKLAECYGLRMPSLYLAQSPAQAAEMARKTGFPTVIKVASPDIPHKSDVDGVLVSLWDEDSVAKGYTQVVERARRALPHAEVSGAYVQQMLPPGQDLIIGALQDPQFGALVMFGSGGIETEQLHDVAFALAPLTSEEAVFLLESTWGGRRLDGYRSLPPADREAVIDVLLRFSHLAADFPELHEIEINPLRALEVGEGAFALDLRARYAPLSNLNITAE